MYGSKYLKHILDYKLVSPKPSTVLDEMYAAGLIHPTRDKSRAAEIPSEEETEEVARRFMDQGNDGDEEVMLLRRWNGKLLAEKLGLPELEVEIERAVEQVEQSMWAEAKSKVDAEEREAAKKRVAEKTSSDTEDGSRR